MLNKFDSLSMMILMRDELYVIEFQCKMHNSWRFSILQAIKKIACDKRFPHFH